MAVFCTISTDTRLVRRTIPEWAGQGARQGAGKLTERFVPSNVLTQGNKALAGAPECRGMHRTRLAVQGLYAGIAAMAAAIVCGEFGSLHRPGATAAPLRPDFSTPHKPHPVGPAG